MGNGDTPFIPPSHKTHSKQLYPSSDTNQRYQPAIPTSRSHQLTPMELYDTVINGQLVDLQHRIEPFSGKPVIERLLQQVIRANVPVPADKYDCLIDNLKHLRTPRIPGNVQNINQHHQNDTILMTALEVDNLQAIQALVNHPHYQPHPDLDLYIGLGSSRGFNQLLGSNKFQVNGGTFHKVVTCSHPAKISAYLASNKCVVPTAAQIRDLFKTIAAFESTVELFIADQRFDLSLVDTPTLLTLIKSESLASLLMRRIPEVVGPLIQRSKDKKEKTVHFLEAKWDPFREV